MNKYSVIYIDPPWRYNCNKGTKLQGLADNEYDCLSLQDLADLPIDKIADDNCVLLMWIVHTKMIEGAHNKLFEAWGFRPVTTFMTWIKTNKDGSPFMGIGHYVRGDSELCLLGIKGKMPIINKDVRQTYQSPRMRHSAKPNDEVRRRIDRVFGPQENKIEIFARPPVPSDWDAIGNDVTGNDIKEDLQKIIND